MTLPKTQRKVHDTSKRNVEKRDREKSYGPYFNSGKPWTNEEIDTLLEGFLVHDWKMESERESFHNQLGRTKDAVESMLWKVSTRYADFEFGRTSAAYKYHPVKRTDRTGTPFTARDKALVDYWLRKGGPVYSLEWIAVVLGRHEDELEKWLYQLARERLSMKPTLGAKEETISGKVLTLAGEHLNGSFERALKHV